MPLKDPKSGSQRPFVLSRAFFAGSQRYGAIWTGDNTATWPHLKITTPMLLSLSLSGLPFVGADVGGFFGNPGQDGKLMTRWYQLAVWQPFLRQHAHLDTKHREPWLFGDVVLQRVKEALKTRYRMVSYWYTLFWEASRSGFPPMR